MKFRILPIALTVIITGSLLFGGWFVYKQVKVQNPLEKIVTEYEGVNTAQLNITRNEVVVKLDIEPGTRLPGLVQQITTEGKSIVGKRTLKLDVKEHPTANINEFWDKAMFPVAEAMENKRYTQIVDKLKEMEQDSTVKVTTEMDDKNVYISLTDGEASKFIILPRDPNVLGVWKNA
ncbi:hypothetical protein [Paenibacillus glacialis]|uniref:Uncharacterized protein n=1 Tax=Paenibacillus glacialis TaxID=494026 RepID=A0A168M784_9BACL|nr:hypothetical protein [Paenibacillus glacialis]OAB44317.1 hypothetical protein PGLA_06555 [Paenibacillus glacialis]